MKILIGFVIGWFAHRLYLWLMLRKQTKVILAHIAELSRTTDKKARVTE
jgi:hypothetical protein